MRKSRKLDKVGKIAQLPRFRISGREFFPPDFELIDPPVNMRWPVIPCAQVCGGLASEISLPTGDQKFGMRSPDR